jgi:hypothetical protein
MGQHVHPDGSICREGTCSVPQGFVARCKAFNFHTTACVFDIRYEWWPRKDHWVICVADGGSSGIAIAFCPHCGKKL